MKTESGPELREISQNRIKQLIDELANGSQQEFSEQTGVAKASISQYVNKTNAPGNITAAKIGQKYGINPLWIMGFPVPKTTTDNSAIINLPNKNKDITLTNQEIDLIERYRTLDEYGRKMIITVLDMECERCEDENNSTIFLQQEEIESLPFRDRLEAIKNSDGFGVKVARKSTRGNQK